jgi:RluA family pseudouridine synthase
MVPNQVQPDHEEIRQAVFRARAGDSTARAVVTSALVGRSAEFVERAFTESARLGALVHPDGPVRCGERFTLRYAATEPAEPIDVQILYEDHALLAANKPAGVPVHPSGEWYNRTLLHALRRGGYGDVLCVHRLDRLTTGVVLFARTAGAAASLGKQFEANRVAKQYWAIVEGHPNWDSHVERSPVVAKAVGPIEHPPGPPVTSKSAETAFRVELQSGAGSPPRTLLEVTPSSGRRHQIRQHLATLGHPIVGDVEYGAKPEPLGMMLHALAVGFIHPLTAEPMRLWASPSEAFARVLKASFHAVDQQAIDAMLSNSTVTRPRAE